MANSIKITIEAPELTRALEALSKAIAGGSSYTAEVDTPQDATAKQTTQAYEVVAPTNQTAPMQNAPTANVQPSVNNTVNYQQTVANTPQTASQPVQNALANTAPEKTYTLDELSRAAAGLITQSNKMPEVLAVLGQFGVQAVSQLQPAQYGPFANAIAQLGAVI